MVHPQAVAETRCSREYFYVGGTYAAAPSDQFGDGFCMIGQTYVECLTPPNAGNQAYPLIFVHGGGQSGLNWLNTPDGRKGWASYFLDHGYTVYLIDTASRGRSAPDMSEEYIHYPTTFVEDHFTASREAMKWPQAALHTQWPGSGRRGDPTFDQYYASTMPSMTDIETYQRLQKRGVSALLKRINRPSILVIHSQGAPGGWLAADDCPSLVKAIVAVEPNGPPCTGTHPHNRLPARRWGLTDIPMTFDPPIDSPSDLQLMTVSAAEAERSAVVLQDDRGERVVHKLKNLAAIPVLIEVGEASYHAPFDHATVAFLQQAGVSCELIRLEELGIKGNGHMQMLELNNLEIAAVLHRWILKVTSGQKV